ncbi:MAG: hypothetical protein Ta2B_08640 [Termitinemataceae bacterium]|nr:MAG: hypothetical protein Ta2B_08640 [Termitinemataceae bacterium]
MKTTKKLIKAIGVLSAAPAFELLFIGCKSDDVVLQQNPTLSCLPLVFGGAHKCRKGGRLPGYWLASPALTDTLSGECFHHEGVL